MSIARSGVFTWTAPSTSSHCCGTARRPRRGRRRGSGDRRLRLRRVCSLAQEENDFHRARRPQGRAWSAVRRKGRDRRRRDSTAAPARASAAGRSRVPLRPRNSRRSAVHVFAFRPGPRTPRARRTPRSRDSARTSRRSRGRSRSRMNGAEAAREGPSTHSTYAVTESRATLREALWIFSREIFIGSPVGTYCEQIEPMPREVCSKRL